MQVNVQMQMQEQMLMQIQMQMMMIQTPPHWLLPIFSTSLLCREHLIEIIIMRLMMSYSKSKQTVVP